MTQFNSTRRTAPSEMEHVKIKRQIYRLMACALFLFVLGTVVLIVRLPSPRESSLTMGHHGVDSVVRKRRSGAVSDSGGSSRVGANGEDGAHPHHRQHPTKFTPKLQHHANKSKANTGKIKAKPNTATDNIGDPDKSNNEEPPPRLIHILETRFMQNQPSLVHLAQARLKLFQTICLPTVIHQSAWGDFLWVIRTDPDLDEGVKEELVRMLEKSGALVKKDKGDATSKNNGERALTYVIGSNDNYILSNSTSILNTTRPYDIRHMLTQILSRPQSIFAGKPDSIKLLLDEISSERMEKDVILWTRLDADDGLNLGYMEYIQSQAVRYFLPSWFDKVPKEEIVLDGDGHLVNLAEKDEKSGKRVAVEGERRMKNVYKPPQWTYWCAGRNIDWFLTDAVHDLDHKNGTVYPVQHVQVCVTPGVTVALRGSFDSMKVPRLDHDKIISYLRPQGGKICGRSGVSIFQVADDDETDVEEPDDGTCFHMVNAYYFLAIRSRTPTSAGMLGISPSLTQLELVKKQPILTYAMWVLMVREFRISNKKLIDTNRYFAEHVYDIAEENARGQCTVGHSCKVS